jgi:hypothetical protein
MRSTTSRLTVALIAALTFVAPFVLMPTPSAWADDVDIDDIGKVKRGEKKVMFRADVEKSDLICTLSVKYADGDTDTVGNDESDKNGKCEIAFDLPDRKSIVGNATAKLKVETRTGADRGKASKNFNIRGRRGD